MPYKKLVCLFFCAALCLPFARAASPAPSAPPADAVPVAAPVNGRAPDAPAMQCISDVLLCAENGEVLLEKGGYTRRAPASITKLMTALVVLENVQDLSVTTTASYEAVHSIERNSTHIALDTGEIMSLKDLMGAMLVESANDAANVLAEYVGGSLSGFADMMNEKAKELGCINTHFVNANGLDDPEHYTTAYDMALIGQALCEYPEVFTFLGSSVYQIPPTNKQTEERQFWTKQNFRQKNSKWYDEDVLGGKNGWTTNANQTLVTFKRVDDVTLIAVAMGGSGKSAILSDTAEMFAYGYGKFHAVTLSGETQADAVREAYPDAALDTLDSTLLLLPNGMKTQDLTFACEGNNQTPDLLVQADGETLLSVPVSLSSPKSNTTMLAVGELADEPKDDSGIGGTLLRGALITAAALAFIFALLCVYRWTRIRHQRRRIRMLRVQKHKDDRGL